MDGLSALRRTAERAGDGGDGDKFPAHLAKRTTKNGFSAIFRRLAQRPYDVSRRA